MKKTGCVFQSHAFSPVVLTFLRFFFLCSHKHYFNHERCDLSSLFFSGTLGAAHTLLFLPLLIFSFFPLTHWFSFFFSSFILTHAHITYSFTHVSVVLTIATLWTLKLTNCLPSVFELQQVAESREDNGKAAVSARYVLHAERGQRSQGLTRLHLVSPFRPDPWRLRVFSFVVKWTSQFVSTSRRLLLSQKYSDWPEWRLKLSW